MSLQHINWTDEQLSFSCVLLIVYWWECHWTCSRIFSLVFQQCATKKNIVSTTNRYRISNHLWKEEKGCEGKSLNKSLHSHSRQWIQDERLQHSQDCESLSKDRTNIVARLNTASDAQEDNDPRLATARKAEISPKTCLFCTHASADLVQVSPSRMYTPVDGWWPRSPPYLWRSNIAVYTYIRGCVWGVTRGAVTLGSLFAVKKGGRKGGKRGENARAAG